jgi:uncharacterized membrane protein YfcA
MLEAAALGALVGCTLALTGAGGGILAVPLLVFGLHLSVAESAPIGLMAVGTAASFGALLGLKDGIVRYRAAMLIGGAGMILAPIGVALGERLPNGPMSLAFAAVMAGSALSTYRRATRTPVARLSTFHEDRPSCVRNPESGRFIWTRPCARVLAAVGMASGILSGLLGVGGGFVILPALTRHSDLEQRAIVATSLAVIGLVSASGIATAATRGTLDWHVASPFALGAVAALLVVRRWAARMGGRRLQVCFAILCALVASLLFERGIAMMVA